MARLKIVAQVDKTNTAVTTFHAVLGNDIRQIGVIQYPISTAWGDGCICNEEITKALQKCFSKTIRNIQK